MKKLKYVKPNNLLVAVVIFILLVSCNNTSEEIKITNLIDQIYKQKDPYRNEKLKENVFSKTLQTLIFEAKKIEKKSIKSIPLSEQNNIKPKIIEAEIFASLYEGYTSYRILKIEN